MVTLSDRIDHYLLKSKIDLKFCLITDLSYFLNCIVPRQDGKSSMRLRILKNIFKELRIDEDDA